MFCKECGTAMNDDAKFCPRCGATGEQTDSTASMSVTESTDFSRLFFDPNEKKVAVLGSSFLRNYLNSGEMSNGSCVLSDKRVYFKGKCYNREGGRLNKTIEESTVDLKDITASGFSKSSKISLLILGWLFLIATVIFMFLSSAQDDFIGLFLIGALFTIIVFTIYAVTKVKLFYIAFAGGKIAFKASNYSQKEMQEFQKALRLAIDAYQEKALTRI